MSIKDLKIKVAISLFESSKTLYELKETKSLSNYSSYGLDRVLFWMEKHGIVYCTENANGSYTHHLDNKVRDDVKNIVIGKRKQ